MFLGRNSSIAPARKALLESVRGRWPLGASAFTLMGLSAAATAGYAWLVGPLLGGLQADLVPESSQGTALGSELFPSLSWAEIAALLVFLGLLRAVAESSRTHFAARFQLGVVREFRGKILAHALSLEPATLADWPPGELASRIQVEVHGVRTLLHMGVAHGIRSILVATALAIVALRVDTALATPGLLIFPFAVLLVLLAARPVRALQRSLFASESELVAETAEAIDGAPVLLAYGASSEARRKIDAGAARSARRALAAETWSASAAPMVELAAALGIALVVLLAWSTRGALDLAATGTVLVALILMYRPLHGLAQAIFGCWSGLAALDRLDELLLLPSDIRRPRAVRSEPLSSLRAEGVRFAYGDEPILNGLQLTLRAGELVAITGPSGAGKSTLLSVLSGALPSEGSLFLDEAPASRDALSAASAWMPQDPSLFHDSILQNIALGDPRPDRGRALEAAQAAGADAFVRARPEGYEAVLREGGTDLSTGQRQRLTLARALYRAAPVLLLDEPSSALDEQQEQNVIAVCRSHADRGGIVVVASHREDFLRRADRVLELRNRTVIEWERAAGNELLH